MAFLNRVGSLLKCNVSKQVTSSLSSASSPSLFQAIRGMCSYPNTRIFVGGLAWATDTPSLREAFSHYGEVVDVKIIEDRETGRSRGFGFVTFASSDAASAAIQALDGQELQGRVIKVNLATEKPRGGGGGGNQGGVNYDSANMYSRLGDHLEYDIGNKYSGGGGADSVQGGGDYSEGKPNPGSLLNEDTSGAAVGGSQGSWGSEIGAGSYDFGAD